jgi:hypothetical protein
VLAVSIAEVEVEQPLGIDPLAEGLALLAALWRQGDVPSLLEAVFLRRQVPGQPRAK